MQNVNQLTHTRTLALSLACREHTPTFRGFDSWLGYLAGGEDYYEHTVGINGTKALDMREQARPYCGADCSTPRPDLVGAYSTHIFTQRAPWFQWEIE